jgi:hypothetical protein
MEITWQAAIFLGQRKKKYSFLSRATKVPPGKYQQCKSVLAGNVYEQEHPIPDGR